MYSISQHSDDVIKIQIDGAYDKCFHCPTYYPNYILAPPTIVVKTNLETNDQEIVRGQPFLPNSWKQGDFIHDNGYLYSRIGQWEFDKLCFYDNHYRSMYPDNAKLYEDTIIKKLNVRYEDN